MDYYSAIMNNEVIPFAATWMNLEIIILSEVRKKNTNIILYYMQNLKYDTDEFIYKIETDSPTQKTDLWLPRGRGFGRGTGSLGFQMQIITYGMDKQDPTVQHGNYIQYFVVNHNEKESEKNHFAVQQKLIQHCKPTIL